MNIWILSHYSYMPEDGPHIRHFALGKYLAREGYKVLVVTSNELHSTGKRINTGNELYIEKECDGVTFVYVKSHHYEKNDVNRVINLFSFEKNAKKVCDILAEKYGKPDIVYSSCFTPTTLSTGIKVAKKHRAICISETRDIIPEGFTKKGALKENGFIAKCASIYMKHMYDRSDALVFTFSGCRNYIADKGWDIAHGGRINLERVFYVNNGVDLEEAKKNAENHVLQDKDLDNPDTKCVVYLGAIRFMNNMPLFMETAEKLKEKGRNDIKILLWGTGTKVEEMQKALDRKGLDNLILKGYAEKKYIPGIANRADMFLGTGNSTIMKYGMSFNKLFDYLAAGKPIILPFKVGYSIVAANRAGAELENADGEIVANEIIRFADMEPNKYEVYCKNSRALAEQYDYKELALHLRKIIEKLSKGN